MIIDELKYLENESIERGIPIIGHENGKWIYNKISELKPKNILELGTANGYSGIILASQGARLTTIEINKKIAKEAEKNFKKFGINANIIIGDAVNIVKKINDKFDLIFLDIEKNKYLDVLDDCINLLNNKGHIIADNLSFDGCKEFKETILNHPKLKTEIIYIGDWLSISKKVAGVKDI